MCLRGLHPLRLHFGGVWRFRPASWVRVAPRRVECCSRRCLGVKRKSRKTGILYNYHFFRLGGGCRCSLRLALHHLKKALITQPLSLAPFLPLRLVVRFGLSSPRRVRLVPSAVQNELFCAVFASVVRRRGSCSSLVSLCRVGARRFRRSPFRKLPKTVDNPVNLCYNLFATIN